MGTPQVPFFPFPSPLSSGDVSRHPLSISDRDPVVECFRMSCFQLFLYISRSLPCSHSFVGSCMLARL